jgi:hypothetical protein
MPSARAALSPRCSAAFVQPRSNSLRSSQLSWTLSHQRIHTGRVPGASTLVHACPAHADSAQVSSTRPLLLALALRCSAALSCSDALLKSARLLRIRMLPRPQCPPVAACPGAPHPRRLAGNPPGPCQTRATLVDSWTSTHPHGSCARSLRAALICERVLGALKRRCHPLRPSGPHASAPLCQSSSSLPTSLLFL